RRNDAHSAYCARSPWHPGKIRRQASCQAFEREARQSCSRTLRQPHSRKANPGGRRKRAKPSDRQARSSPLRRFAPLRRPRSKRVAKSGKALCRSAQIACVLLLVLVAKTCPLRVGCQRRLIFMLLRPSARDRIVRPCTEININIVDIAHDVFVIAERRHDLVFAAAEILLTTNNNPIKFLV